MGWIEALRALSARRLFPLKRGSKSAGDDEVDNGGGRENIEFNARRWEELSLDSGLWQGRQSQLTAGECAYEPGGRAAHNDCCNGQIYKKLDELLPKGHLPVLMYYELRKENKVPDVMWTTIDTW